MLSRLASLWPGLLAAPQAPLTPSPAAGDTGVSFPVCRVLQGGRVSGQRENPASGAFRLHTAEGPRSIQSGHRGLRRWPRLRSHILSAWEQMWQSRAWGGRPGLSRCRWTGGGGRAWLDLPPPSRPGRAPARPPALSPGWSSGHKDWLADTCVPTSPLIQFLPQGRFPTQEHTGGPVEGGAGTVWNKTSV